MPGSGANAVGAPPQQQFSRPVDFTPSQAQQVNFLFISESLQNCVLVIDPERFKYLDVFMSMAFDRSDV